MAELNIFSNAKEELALSQQENKDDKQAAEQEVLYPDQLFRDGRMNQNEIIDEYERQNGKQKRKPAIDVAKIVRRTKMLDLDKLEDQEFLETICNDGKNYAIIKWSENWTKEGNYRVFIIYEDARKAWPTKRKPKTTNE